MTQFYGLKPWDVDRMTLRELSEYVAQMEQAMQRNDDGEAYE